MRAQLGSVPDVRIRSANGAGVRAGGKYVLYWMTAFRRPSHNFALQRAADWARHLGKPLVVLEALSVDYRWASDRLHAFVVDGMQHNADALRAGGAVVHSYVEPTPGAGRGLVEALTADAAVVIGDDAPIHDLPTMITAVAPRLDAQFEVVDSNGIFPLRATERVFGRAYDFRRFMQKNLLDHLEDAPAAHPLEGLTSGAPDLIGGITRRWAAPSTLDRSAVEALPVDHAVGATAARGGVANGHERLSEFVEHRLDDYGNRNHPDEDVTSGLSPYLHFGHVSAHEVVEAVLAHAGWSPDKLADRANGQREGWWGAGEAAEGFLDQVVTWRELGYNMAWHVPDHETYESLPAWALDTLADHATDPRPHLYDFDEFLEARTHDRIWNAAQNQLLQEGVIHNYLRMLWGKKILEWTPTPQRALETMIELNNRLAIDGRDPNSTSGIFWVLGRYDRPWPERAVYGKVRTMTSDSTKRKLRLRQYLDRYAPDEGQLALG